MLCVSDTGAGAGRGVIVLDWMMVDGGYDDLHSCLALGGMSCLFAYLHSCLALGGISWFSITTGVWVTSSLAKGLAEPGLLGLQCERASLTHKPHTNRTHKPHTQSTHTKHTQSTHKAHTHHNNTYVMNV